MTSNQYEYIIWKPQILLCYIPEKNVWGILYKNIITKFIISRGRIKIAVIKYTTFMFYIDAIRASQINTAKL